MLCCMDVPLSTFCLNTVPFPAALTNALGTFPVLYILDTRSHCHRLLPIEVTHWFSSAVLGGGPVGHQSKEDRFDSPSRRKTLYSGVFVATNLHSTGEWGLVVSFLRLRLFHDHNKDIFYLPRTYALFGACLPIRN